MSPVITGIILARIDSTRLPGKVLRQVHGIPLIDYVIRRAKHINKMDKLFLATTNRSIDDPLAEHAHLQGITVYRGDVDNVALRVLKCARAFHCDYFVRLNGDSPFLDPDLITQGITYCYNTSVDMVTNLIGRTFPYGIAVEIIRTYAFEQAYNKMSQQHEREHVTRYLYDHQEEFTVQSMTSAYPELRSAHLVVDNEDDLEVFDCMVGKLGTNVYTADYREVASLYMKMFGNDVQEPNQGMYSVD